MNTKKLMTCAMMISIATVLSVIQPFQLPFGGGITVASMVPLILIGYMYGTRQGLFCGCIYGFLQMIIGSSTVAAFFLPGDSQLTLFAGISVCLLDYICAYTVLGFGGIFKTKLKNTAVSVAVGSIFATILRYIIHIISGAIFFGSWAEWFFTQEGFYAVGSKIVENFSGGMLALIYSVVYNGLYMIPEIIITAVTAPIIYRACVKSHM